MVDLPVSQNTDFKRQELTGRNLGCIFKVVCFLVCFFVVVVGFFCLFVCLFFDGKEGWIPEKQPERTKSSFHSRELEEKLFSLSHLPLLGVGPGRHQGVLPMLSAVA